MGKTILMFTHSTPITLPKEYHFHILIAISFIGCLAILSITTALPLKHYAQTRDSIRQHHLHQIQNALRQYRRQYNQFPDVLPTNQETAAPIGTTGSACSPLPCVDLTSYLSDYLPLVPFDPLYGYPDNTRYQVYLEHNSPVLNAVCESDLCPSNTYTLR